MVRVLTFGTFDLLHEGHIAYLNQAKALGDELYVLVACDQAVEWAKGYKPVENEAIRLKTVQKLPTVHKAWLGEPVKVKEDYLRPIIEIKPDIIALGYDQALDYAEWLAGQLAQIKPQPIMVRLKPYKPEIYKTSKLKKGL